MQNENSLESVAFVTMLDYDYSSQLMNSAEMR